MSDIRAVKRNISMQHWAAIIADRNTTDLTVKEYCTRNNLSRNSYFYWLRQLRQEAADSLDLKSLTKNTVRQEENCIVELLPSGKKEMVAPEFIQEDETADESEGDSLKTAIPHFMRSCGFLLLTEDDRTKRLAHFEISLKMGL